LQAAYTQNVYSQGPYTFDAIVAVLIGGTSVLGGKGSLIRTVFGALVVSYLSQMMIMRGYNPPTQIFVQGLLLFGVVVVMQLSERGRN
jgi:simple sugar transport system permease protein/ribose transport system permease protein